MIQTTPSRWGTIVRLTRLPASPVGLPYQPSLLRLLHGATAVGVSATWITGLMVYNQHDGRWGRLPWHWSAPWIDLHGSAGVLLWPVALLFGLYALSLGRRRLRQPGNAAALLALGLAVGSGKLMQEDWLRRGELQHLVISLHLLGWLLLSAMVLWHLAVVLQRGGPALAASMLSLRCRPSDTWRDWPAQLRRALPWR